MSMYAFSVPVLLYRCVLFGDTYRLWSRLPQAIKYAAFGATTVFGYKVLRLCECRLLPEALANARCSCRP